MYSRLGDVPTVDPVASWLTPPAPASVTDLSLGVPNVFVVPAPRAAPLVSNGGGAASLALVAGAVVLAALVARGRL